MRVRVRDIVDAVRSALRPKVEGVHSEEVFRSFLRHERAVAERNDLCVTVLAFFATEERMAAHAAQVLGRILSDSLRATDVAGWLDCRTIGVILPNTRVKNAVLVAERISHRMLADGVRLPYKFYLFPHDECGRSDGQLELPLPRDCDRPISAWPEVPRCGVADSPSSEEFRGEVRRQVDAYPFADICVLPISAWKRGLDIVLCLFGLVVLGPVMLAIAVGIKLASPGPVLFRQERIGFRGKPFVLFKFRSMRIGADTNVHKEHLAGLMRSNASLTKLDKADVRLIPFGRIFRASGLDELPQLFNILQGDMTLVGPRPCIPYEYEQFSPWHKRRCDAYPGLTGLWQVSGKNKTTFTEMMRLDVAYGLRQTVARDLGILARTFSAVVRQIRESSSKKR